MKNEKNKHISYRKEKNDLANLSERSPAKSWHQMVEGRTNTNGSGQGLNSLNLSTCNRTQP